jgi:tetratricopeptide (TPR) repeat protein
MVRKGELDQAWSLMRKAMDTDPTSVAHQRRSVGDYYEPAVEAVRNAAKPFEAAHDENNWLPQIYAAVAQYHAGEVERPQVALDRALAADPTSLPALIYRAQIELDKKRYDTALEFAKKVIKAERQSAVGFYLQGRAEEGLKRLEAARGDYLAALERDPGLIPANTRLGVLSAEDDKEGAKRSFQLALQGDPNNLEAIVGLFKLGW